MTHIREELKQKYPGLWKHTYQDKWRSSAIRLFCIECMGGQNSEVPKCTDKGCPLYNFRMASRRNDPQSIVDDDIEDVESTNVCQTLSEDIEPANMP